MVVAADLNGEAGSVRWAVARGAHNWVSNVPQEMVDKLVTFTDDGTEVDVLAFAPDGGWTVVAGDKYWSRVAGDYARTLKELIAQGRTIQAVAFNPVGWERDHGYVIAHAGGVTGEHVPDELLRRLSEFVRDGADIYDIEFTPDGGWTFLASTGDWTRNISGGTPGYYATLTALRDRGDRAQAAAFLGSQERWLIVDGTTVHDYRAPDGLVKALDTRFGLVVEAPSVRDTQDKGAAGTASDAVEELAGNADGEAEEPEPGTVSEGIASVAGNVSGPWRLSRGEPDYSAKTRGWQWATTTRRLDLGTAVAYGIRLARNATRPCFLEILGKLPNGHEISKSINCRHGKPHGHGMQLATLGENHAVSGLSVCHNKKVPGADFELLKIEGVEARGALIHPDGSLDPTTSRDQIGFGKCQGNWRILDTISCPSGQVASGVIAYLDRDTKLARSAHVLTALQLICRDLIPDDG